MTKIVSVTSDTRWYEHVVRHNAQNYLGTTVEIRGGKNKRRPRQCGLEYSTKKNHILIEFSDYIKLYWYGTKYIILY